MNFKSWWNVRTPYVQKIIMGCGVLDIGAVIILFGLVPFKIACFALLGLNVAAVATGLFIWAAQEQTEEVRAWREERYDFASKLRDPKYTKDSGRGPENVSLRA